MGVGAAGQWGNGDWGQWARGHVVCRPVGMGQWIGIGESVTSASVSSKSVVEPGQWFLSCSQSVTFSFPIGQSDSLLGQSVSCLSTSQFVGSVSQWSGPVSQSVGLGQCMDRVTQLGLVSSSTSTSVVWSAVSGVFEQPGVCQVVSFVIVMCVPRFSLYLFVACLFNFYLHLFSGCTAFLLSCLTSACTSFLLVHMFCFLA